MKENQFSDDAFDFIYDDKGDCSHLICKSCKERVERGIINISGHWVKCSGKEFSDNLINIKARKGMAPLTIDDIINLRK